MADKKNLISKFVIDTVMIIFSLFKVIPNFISLVEMEARAAGKSVINLLILYLVAGVLLMAIWFCINGMCLAYLVSLQLSIVLSLFFIMIMNIMLLVITALIIVKTTNNLSFAKTRHLLRQINK